MRAALLPLLVLMSACDSSDGTGQVMANVNGREISVHQFNHVIKLAGTAPVSREVQREVSARLVERELAIQQALTLRLDRQPEVMFQLEEAKREVLARAYAGLVAGAGAQPAKPEIARYYSEHPELFAKRKIFQLQEVVLPVGMRQFKEAQLRLSKHASMDELLAWLKREDAEFSTQFSVRSAEQLPIEALSKLNAAPDGSIAIFESPSGVVVYRLLSAQDSPLAWDRAAPLIASYLSRQAGRQALEAKMQNLKTAARIEYAGEFANLHPAREGG